MNRSQIKEEWLSRAKGSSGGDFAVAFALLELADETAKVASGLRLLGTNDAATSMGAIEFLATEVTKISEAIENFAEKMRSDT